MENAKKTFPKRCFVFFFLVARGARDDSKNLWHWVKPNHRKMEKEPKLFRRVWEREIVAYTAPDEPTNSCRVFVLFILH